jgi:glutaredoxin
MARLTVYGRTTCEDTIRSRALLDRHKVRYEWVDVEKSADGARVAREKNHGKLSTPTIVFEDGSVLVEPSDDALATKLRLRR